MTDMNSQARPGGSKSGSTAPERVELTHEQFEHEKEKRDSIHDHQHKDDGDEFDAYTYIQETD